MTFNSLQSIVINVAVIFIVATVAAGILPGTANTIFAAVKDRLGFGEPSIGDFKVLAPSQDKLSVVYSILGDYNEIEKVVFSRQYKRHVDDLWSDRATGTYKDDENPSVKNDVAKILSDKEPRGKVVSDIRIEEPSKGADEKVGLHRFTLELFYRTEDGIFTDSASVEKGLYDEKYVELYHQKIGSCPGSYECNVIECKKAAVNKGLEGLQVSVAPAVIGITNELSSESCASFDLYGTPKIGFGACGSEEQVDDFNKEFARVWMLKAASQSKGITSEKEYSELSSEETESVKEHAVSDAMFCSDELYGFLASQKWVSVAPISGLRVLTLKNNLDNVLLTRAYPKIESLEASPISEDSAVDLSWGLVMAGSGNVKKFEFRHEITKYARPYDAAANPGYSKPLQDVQYLQRSIKGEELQEFGRHKFELKVFAKDGAETDKKSVVRGKFNDFYPDSYLELYNGKVELPGYEKKEFNIIDLEKAYLNIDFLERGGIVSESEEAGIVAEKLNQKLRVKYPAGKCELKDNGELREENDCSHEEIRELYSLAVLEAINFKGVEYASNVLTCSIPPGSTNPPRRHPDYIHPGYICEAKAELKQALLEHGWQEVVQPDKDAAIQAAVDKFADEVANPVVTDLKAVASLSQPRKLELTWSMPLGKMNVLNDAILLQHWRTQYLENLDWTKEEQPPVTSVPVEPAKYYFEPADLTGQHKFRFTAWSKDESSSDVKILITGVYDRDYVERYSKNVEDCKKTYGVSKQVESIGCNVIDVKANVFIDKPLPGLSDWLWGDEKLIPRRAFYKFREALFSETGKGPDCVFDWEKSKLARSDGSPCSSEHVDRLYNFLIEEASGGGIFAGTRVKNCDNEGFSSELFFYVCTAKDNLINTLQDKGWLCSGEGCPKPGVVGGRP